MNDASFVEQLRTGGSLLLRPPEGILAFERHVVEHMQKTELDALPAILSKPGVIPSVPVVEEEHATITNSVIQNLDVGFTLLLLFYRAVICARGFIKKICY